MAERKAAVKDFSQQQQQIRHTNPSLTFAMPKQLIVQSSIEEVEIIDTPIPVPKQKELVIKVVVSGTNPKDWKYPLWYVMFCHLPRM